MIDQPATPTTSAVSERRQALRPPSLRHIGPAGWRQAASMAYRFVRQARHDMANLQTGIQLLDLVEQLPPGQDLPPELQPQAIKDQTRKNIRELVNTATDQVLIGQAASTVAYEPAARRPLGDLLRDAIDHRTPEASGLTDRANVPEDAQVVSLGDMLQAALSVMQFQWTPAFSEAPQRPYSAHRVAGGVELYFHTPSTPHLSHFVHCGRCAEGEAPCALGSDLTAGTPDLALCLARHIIHAHGGWVDLEEIAPGQTRLVVALPLK